MPWAGERLQHSPGLLGGHKGWDRRFAGPEIVKPTAESTGQADTKWKHIHEHIHEVEACMGVARHCAKWTGQLLVAWCPLLANHPEA